MLASEMDFGDVNPNTVEAVAEAGGFLPKGKYHVRLDGASDRESKRSAGTGTELEFTCLAGPFVGSKIKDTVWNPQDTGDAEKDAKTKNRYMLVGHRLGLLAINPKTKRYEPAPGKEQFNDCLGAEVVIDVEHRKYKRDDGGEGMAINVTFGGYYALNDPKVKDVLKAAPGSAEKAKLAVTGVTTGKKPLTSKDL